MLGLLGVQLNGVLSLGINERGWGQGALWMSADKQTKGSSPELHGHDLCRLEGRSTMTARWGLEGLSPLFHLPVQLTL